MSVRPKIPTPVSSKKSITLYRKRGLHKVDSENINKFVTEGKVIIKSDSMSVPDCIKLLKADISIAEVLEVPSGTFNEMLRQQISGKQSSVAARGPSIVN